MKTISRIVSVVGRNLAIALVCAALGTATNAGAVSLVSKSYMDGETVYLTTNGVTVMSGWTLPEGTTVKLSARGDKDFLRWIGDVTDGVDATSREINVTLGTEDLQITPLYNKMWVVDNLEKNSDNATTGMIYCVERGITNWSIRTQVTNKNKRELQVGYGQYHDLITQIEGELDLSTPVVDREGNSWTIWRLGQGFLGQPNDGASLATSVIVPKTLTTLSGQVFHNANFTVLTNLVIDCPNVTDGLGEATFNSCTKLKTLTLNLPKATYISEASFPNGSMAGMDVSEWDFSSVTKFSCWGWLTWGARGFSGKEFTGTIRLPKMQTFLTNNFANAKNLLAAEVGTYGNTLKNLGFNTFGGTCGIKSITIGGTNGWIAATNSVTFKNGLAQVIFLSTPPTIPDGGTFVNETDTAALSVCFYIPKDNQADWNEVTGRIVRSATPEEIAVFCAAHPGAEPPVSVVDAGTLGSKHQQFLGWSVPATTKLTWQVGDPRFGGSVTVSPDKKFFKPYEEVTLTANPADGTTFTRWVGLPAGATNYYESTITFKAGDKPLEITMWAGPDWTYVVEEGLITNKVWKLNATGVSDSNLRIGSSTTYSAYTGYGEGILDLSGKVYDAEDSGKEWTITEFGSGLFHSRPKGENNNRWVEVMTGLVIPRTLTTIGTKGAGSGQWLNCNALGSVLKLIILDAPGYEGWFSSYTFNCRSTSQTVLNLPGLKSLDGQEAFAANVGKSDVDTWNLSGLKTIKTGSMRMDGSSSGTLHLESLTTVDVKGLADKRIAGYEFGTGYEPKSNAKLSLAHCALSNNVSLVRIKFGPYAEINLADDTVFAKCAALKKIVFEGRPTIVMSVIDNLLCEAAPIAEQTEPVVIYASAALHWDKIDRLVGLADLTTEEKALMPQTFDDPSARVLGAFKCADDSKRAWLVSYRSRFDPKGTILIVR